MLEIPIDASEIPFMWLFRVALSEESDALRKQAIQNVKHEAMGSLLQELPNVVGEDWVSDPGVSELVQWVAKTSGQRHEAIYAFGETVRRYEEKNERKLNIAEEIGNMIWVSIQDKMFEGVQTRTGILAQLRDQAIASGLRGARDKDTVRKIWDTYRGVVHVGMALTYCEDNPDPNLNVLHVAERFRRDLSQHCPRGTSSPYVNPKRQISFYYSSML